MNKNYNDLDESEKEEVRLDFENKQKKFYYDFLDFIEDKAHLSAPIPICKCLLEFVIFNINYLKISKNEFFNLVNMSWEKVEKILEEEGSNDNF